MVHFHSYSSQGCPSALCPSALSLPCCGDSVTDLLVDLSSCLKWDPGRREKCKKDGETLEHAGNLQPFGRVSSSLHPRVLPSLCCKRRRGRWAGFGPWTRQQGRRRNVGSGSELCHHRWDLGKVWRFSLELRPRPSLVPVSGASPRSPWTPSWPESTDIKVGEVKSTKH